MRGGGHICRTLRYIVCCKCSVPISCNLQELFWTWWTSQTGTVERYEWPSWFGHRHSPCQNLACATCRSVNREEREGRGQKGWCISFLTSNFIFSLSLTLPSLTLTASPETGLPPQCSSCPCWCHTQCAVGGRENGSVSSWLPEPSECPSYAGSFVPLSQWCSKHGPDLSAPPNAPRIPLHMHAPEGQRKCDDNDHYKLAKILDMFMCNQ